MIDIAGHLTRLAEYKEMDSGFTGNEKPGDWDLIRDRTIHSVWVGLDMRYQTYAEGSWTTEVITNYEATKSCTCSDCAKWNMRYFQLMQEVEYAIGCQIHEVRSKQYHAN